MSSADIKTGHSQAVPILGGDTQIGAHSVIGSNVWLIESIPDNSIAYYKEANIVVRSRRKKEALIESGGDWVI